MRFTLISNIFAPHVRGGYELGCQTIAQRLVDNGHEVTVLTSAAPGALEKTGTECGLAVRRIFAPIFAYEEQLGQALSRSVPWHRQVSSSIGGVVPSNAIALQDYLEEHPTDVIWLFNPLGLGPVGIVEVIVNQRAKCLIHFMDHIDDPVAAHQRFHNYSARWRRNKRRLTAISCSEKIRRSNEKLGAYRSHHVIFNGFSPAEIKTPVSRQPPEGAFSFLYFGQLSREKGVPQVVKAFASLVRRRPNLDCRLDLVGRGATAFEAELRELVRTENVGARVRCLGFMPKEQLMSILPQYDAAVMLLSPAEPFGYAPLEAVCGGLAVVTTAGTGVAENFPPSYPLLVADRENAADVLRKIEWCVTHRSELRPLARRLWQDLAVRCDFDRVTMPAYMKAIEECPLNNRTADLRPLLAASATSEFFSLAS